MNALPLDPDAPRRVAPDTSLWVMANAGAGKTRVLIDRVVRLLIAGTPPERILCLTFTKAAAAEMATRLSERLGEYALMEDAKLGKALEELHIQKADGALLAHTRTLFARALETPGGLKIQTIHAFCEKLLGRFPIEAGVAPHFEVLDDRTQGDLLRAAQHFVLEHLTDAAAQNELALIAQNLSEEGFSGLVKDLMRFARDIPDDFEALLWPIFNLAEGTSEQSVRAAALKAFDEGLMRRCCAALGEGSVKDQEKCNIISAFLAAPSRADALDAYMRAFLTAKGEPLKSIATKPLCKDHPWLEEAMRAEQNRIETLRKDLLGAQAAALARAALLIGRAVIARYKALKDFRAALDFDDLIRRTVDLLEKHEAAQWVLFKLDGGLDHILVDEAQDTNPDQWRVIAALAEEFFSGRGVRENIRTLFVVGDDKQSIYSFQGADPHAFSQMMETFKTRVEGAGFKWSDHIMKMSWRTTAPILKLVDAVFPKSNHQCRRLGDAGLVELWPTEKPDDTPPPELWSLPVDYQSPESPRARLARKIARQVRDWIERKEILPSQARAIRPGDVMILVRRRNGFVDEVIRALKQQGIAVAGSDRLSLTEHIAVMDLMALICFVLLPEDDLTLATLLKSPLFGFDDEALFALLHKRAGTAFDALRQAATPHARGAFAALAQLRDLADAMPPFAFLSHVLGPWRGREKLISRLGADANDPIDELLRLALEYERQNPPSLQGFLHWLERGQAEVKRDMEHGRDEVRVMTVHGAKGLEANIVILPDTCSLPHDKSRPGFYALEAPGGVSLPVWSVRKGDAPPCLEAARAAERQAAEEEHLRLLYVALTRARDRLYVCGYQGKKALPASSWHALVSAAMETLEGVEKIEREDGTPVLRLSSAQTETPKPKPDEDMQSAVVPLPAFAKSAPPAEPPPLRWLAPSALDETGASEPPVRSPLTGAQLDKLRFLRGRLIHRLLEALPALPPGRWEDAAQRFLAQPLYGLDDAAQADIAQAALTILNDTELSALFGPGSRAEVPIVGMLDTRNGPAPLHGVVDRLAISGRNIFVIDYKTNRPPPLRAEDVPLLYIRQMAAYRAVLRQIYPGHSVTCALLWTEGPHLMALGEVAMDRALAQIGVS